MANPRAHQQYPATISQYGSLKRIASVLSAVHRALAGMAERLEWGQRNSPERWGMPDWPVERVNIALKAADQFDIERGPLVAQRISCAEECLVIDGLLKTARKTLVANGADYIDLDKAAAMVHRSSGRWNGIRKKTKRCRCQRSKGPAEKKASGCTPNLGRGWRSHLARFFPLDLSSANRH